MWRRRALVQQILTPNQALFPLCHGFHIALSKFIHSFLDEIRSTNRMLCITYLHEAYARHKACWEEIVGTSPWEWLGNFLKEVILGRVLNNDFFFLGWCIRILQRNSTNKIQMEIYYRNRFMWLGCWEVLNLSYSVHFISWEARWACDVIQSGSRAWKWGRDEGWGREQWCNSQQSPRAGEDECPSSNWESRSTLLQFFSFYLSPQ